MSSLSDVHLHVDLDSRDETSTHHLLVDTRGARDISSTTEFWDDLEAFHTQDMSHTSIDYTLHTFKVL